MAKKPQNSDETIHLLRQLTLPDRFENLFDRVGPEVARLLVAPSNETVRNLETAALSINARNEGVFVPLYGKSGVGKTTLARNLTTFFPSTYTATVNYEGKVTYDELVKAVRGAKKKHAANESRVIPLNLDHRESDPPSSAELAAMKRFLRRPSPGARCALLWPETSRERADAIAASYIDVAGEPAIRLPLVVGGPDVQTWPSIAVQTLELANQVSSIAELGIDPRDYDANAFQSLGAFLRKLSNDFSSRLAELIASTKVPLTLLIVIVSESPDAGVLTQLTNPGRFGLLEPRALLDATSGSVVGRWWKKRTGLLTQTILQLNAHVFSLPPAPSMSVVRRYGHPEAVAVLREASLQSPGAPTVAKTLARSDMGRFLSGESKSAFESRGKPPATSTRAFKALAKAGFTHGKDKKLNEVFLAAWEDYLARNELPYSTATSETKLDFCGLIPDNAIHQDKNVVCIEYTWRSGDYLISTNRATIAAYILGKLQNYARELGWTGD